MMMAMMIEVDNDDGDNSMILIDIDVMTIEHYIHTSHQYLSDLGSYEWMWTQQCFYRQLWLDCPYIENSQAFQF
jgi:hypothetical protein